MSDLIWPERSIITPNDLSDLLQKLATERLLKYSFVWRGVADIAWRLDPSGVRKLATELAVEPQDVTEDQVSTADQRLLAAARAAEVDKDHTGVPLTDDQLRARLQHHGAATRLLDVSSSAFTALWMAVNEGDQESTGALFAIDMPVGDPSTFTSTPLAEAIKSDPKALYLWDVRSSVDPRIRAQKGKFLASAVPDRPESKIHSTLALEFVDRDNHRLFNESPGPGRYSSSPTIVFALAPYLKKQVSSFLSQVAGMTSDEVYPDLSGFARSQGVPS